MLLMNNSESPVRKKIQNSCTEAFLCQHAKKLLSVWKYPCLKKILLFPRLLKHSSTVHSHAKMSKGVQQQKGKKETHLLEPLLALESLQSSLSPLSSCSILFGSTACFFKQEKSLNWLLLLLGVKSSRVSSC